MKGVKAKVLINSGASYNFISPRPVPEVRLIVKNDKGCWVKVGDGYQIKSKGVYWDVTI